MDAAQIYAETLYVLSAIVVKMTTPEWDDLQQKATPEQRRAAARLLISAQHARMALGNAVLQDIVQRLKENEVHLRAGIDAVVKELEALAAITNVLNAISGLLTAVGRIVALA